MSQSNRRKWIALLLLCMVQFMVVLDIAIVNVALPSIQIDLGFSQENLQWVISAYSLVFGGFLLLGGRLADLLGRRRVFMVGLVIFTIGSLLCGLSWSEGSLIAARALQGLGAATISPAALSILTTMFREGRERNIALGAWGAVGGVGAAAGVLLGGVLVDLLSWPWIFYVNVPVGIISLIAAPILLAESRDERESSFDVLGALLVTSGLSILVLGITKGHDWGWSSGRTIGVFAVAAVLLVGFIAQESRAAPSADAVLDLPAADADGGEHRDVHHGHGAVLDVPDADALHAAGAPLLAAEDGRRVSRGRRDGDHLGERRRGRGDPSRREADARRRHVRDDGRPRPVHAGLGRRLVLEEPLPGLPRDRLRDAARLRLAHDRGARRDA